MSFASFFSASAFFVRARHQRVVRVFAHSRQRNDEQLHDAVHAIGEKHQVCAVRGQGAPGIAERVAVRLDSFRAAMSKAYTSAFSWSSRRP